MIRFLDIFFASLGIIMTSPFLVIIACAIWWEDGRPLLFKQIRVGRGGAHFTIYKFRSMYEQSPERAHGTVIGTTQDDKERARAQFKTTTHNDPRITKVGKVIRKTHLDELPQLLNVVLGDMSLVGVRPDTPAQEVDYSAEHWQNRHCLRPGITGPSQVMMGSGGTLLDRTHWEKTWVDNPSYFQYLKIIFKTLFKVLKRNSF